MQMRRAVTQGPTPLLSVNKQKGAVYILVFFHGFVLDYFFLILCLFRMFGASLFGNHGELSERIAIPEEAGVFSRLAALREKGGVVGRPWLGQ